MMALGVLFWVVDGMMYPVNLVCSDCARVSNTLTFSMHDEGRQICEYCADKEIIKVEEYGVREYSHSRAPDLLDVVY